MLTLHLFRFATQMTAELDWARTFYSGLSLFIISNERSLFIHFDKCVNDKKKLSDRKVFNKFDKFMLYFLNEKITVEFDWIDTTTKDI